MNKKHRTIMIGDEYFISIKALSSKFKKSTYTTRKAIRDGELPLPVKFMGEKGWFAKHLIEFFDEIHENNLRQEKRFEKLKHESLK